MTPFSICNLLSLAPFSSGGAIFSGICDCGLSGGGGVCAAAMRATLARLIARTAAKKRTYLRPGEKSRTSIMAGFSNMAHSIPVNLLGSP